MFTRRAHPLTIFNLKFVERKKGRKGLILFLIDLENFIFVRSIRKTIEQVSTRKIGRCANWDEHVERIFYFVGVATGWPFFIRDFNYQAGCNVLKNYNGRSRCSIFMRYYIKIKRVRMYEKERWNPMEMEMKILSVDFWKNVFNISPVMTIMTMPMPILAGVVGGVGGYDLRSVWSIEFLSCDVNK